MITIQLDEETLTTLIFAAAQSSCCFDRNVLKDNQMWHLYCCDYNEPIYEVAKQINLTEIQDDDNRAYLQDIKDRVKEYYSEEQGNEKQN